MLTERYLAVPEELASEPRRLFIYVPDGHEGEHFPVLYMFDGHNVFLDSTATYGKSWGMLEYLERTGLPLMVVGVDCNHEGVRRLEEYSPYDEAEWHYGFTRGQGDITMRWMAEELKPMIDREFPTIPDREHTYIGGSSMGGLMSIYAATKYNEVFSRAAALSPSVYVGHAGILSDIRRMGDFLPNTRIYMDMGSEEMRELRGYTMSLLGQINQEMIIRGADTCLRIVSGGSHCEASWEKQIPIFMRALRIRED